MNYVGIDIHKRYSVLAAIDERGQELRRGRINGNSAFGFAQFFAALAGPSKVVLEACWNWGRIHDLLKEIDSIEEVVLAHFGGLYRQHRARGKNANVAITIIARRMCQISWTLLKERRDFYETFPGRSAVRLTAAA